MSERPFDRSSEAPVYATSGAAYPSSIRQALRVTVTGSGRYAMPLRPYKWGVSRNELRPVVKGS